MEEIGLHERQRKNAATDARLDVQSNRGNDSKQRRGRGDRGGAVGSSAGRQDGGADSAQTRAPAGAAGTKERDRGVQRGACGAGAPAGGRGRILRRRPAAIALAHRYNMDSRDQGRAERMSVIGNSEGIWECTFVGECSDVCPKHVDPAAAIQRSKLATTNDFMFRLLMPWSKR